MTAPLSDPQRDAVYYLEGLFFGQDRYEEGNRNTLLPLLKHVCNYYKVEVPRLRIVNQPEEDAAGWVVGKSITLNRGRKGANTRVLLHETAHYLTDTFYKDHEAHGPEFVAIYMHLLDNYRILPTEAFKILARRERLKIGRRFRPVAFRRR